MSLRRRLVRLEREVEWLWWWGRLAAVEHRMKMIEIQKAMARAEAEKAKQRTCRPERSEGPRASPKSDVDHSARSFAALRMTEEPAAPRDEEVRVEDAPDPPLAWWRERRSEDYEDDGRGRVLVDYDPLADDG
ncbi:MAG: hypothetical protein JSR24_07335 [Proteobacteria bacterium]|nr:hypothetical protein [Pseudomonadota bacterium]